MYSGSQTGSAHNDEYTQQCGVAAWRQEQITGTLRNTRAAEMAVKKKGKVRPDQRKQRYGVDLTGSAVNRIVCGG